MGTLPITTKDSKTGANNFLKFSACSMQGWRLVHEDSQIAELTLPNGEAIFGVFDGHGGKEVALYVRENLVETLKKLPEYQKG